jgi:hypothetical protein
MACPTCSSCARNGLGAPHFLHLRSSAVIPHPLHLEEPSSPTLWQTHGPACCMAHAAAGWSPTSHCCCCCCCGCGPDIAAFPATATRMRPCTVREGSSGHPICSRRSGARRFHASRQPDRVGVQRHHSWRTSPPASSFVKKAATRGRGALALLGIPPRGLCMARQLCSGASHISHMR